MAMLVSEGALDRKGGEENAGQQWFGLCDVLKVGSQRDEVEPIY